MGSVRNPFARMDKRGVIGALGAMGTRDPDCLRDAKRRLIRSLRLPQAMGTVVFLIGVVVALGLRRVLPAVLLAMVAWWLWYRGARNVAMVEAGYREFVKSPKQ